MTKQKVTIHPRQTVYCRDRLMLAASGASRFKCHTPPVMNRRDFTRSAFVGSLASLTLPSWLMAADSPGNHYLPTIGLQVWTVRTELEKDIPGTLRAVKQAGYSQIEL